MNIKRHRVVSHESPFQGVANALKDRALQSAENEGWPIPDEAAEPMFALPTSNTIQRISLRMVQHARDEFPFWSGRSSAPQRVAPPARRVITPPWSTRAQASRP